MGDAFSAGVKPGGLFSYQEIKILICYMLMGIPAPLPRQAILDILSGEEMANFFEAEAAIDELIRQHHLVEENDELVLTETGNQVATTLLSRIHCFILSEQRASISLERMELNSGLS